MPIYLLVRTIMAGKRSPPLKLNEALPPVEMWLASVFSTSALRSAA